MLENLERALILTRGRDDSLSQQLTEKLRTLILSGRIPGGQRLPSSRALAVSLKVSRNTVTSAIEQLEAEGYLDTARGRAPIVRALDPGVTPAPPNQTGRGRQPALTRWAVQLAESPWLPPRLEPPRPLRRSSADDREFPHDIWARCLRRAARTRSNQDPKFNRSRLRSALCAHLATHRGTNARPEQIILLPTAQAGLSLISSVLLEAGDVAWVESPGYGGAGAAFSSAAAQIVGIPLDGEGIAVSSAHATPRVIFTTPSHQFPTGRLMTMKRRLDLLRFAEANNAWVIEDDYDGEFHYDERPVPCLQGLARSDRVIYLGTFSKTMFSGLRIGYLIVPSSLVEIFSVAQRHCGYLASLQVQDALADFIADGHFLAHLRKARRIYHARRDYLLNALNGRFENLMTVERPAGGMQLVAWCHDRIDDICLSRRFAKAGVVVEPVSDLCFGDARHHGLLFGFARWREQEIEKALVKMDRALASD